jgi:5-methylcytosine-specific restriction enzyme subunit McrC
VSSARMITVFEDRYSKQSFTEQQRKELINLEEVWGRQHLILRAGDRLSLRKYVGFIATPSLQLQILPKIYDDIKDINDSAVEQEQAVGMLFRLLHSSGFLKVKDIPNPQTIRDMGGDLLEIYIHIFVKRFLELFQRQIHRSYEDREDNMVMIKGRILFQQHLLRNAGFKHKHYVSYQEFTEDNLLNRILKTVLTSLRTVTKNQSNKKNLNIALVYLEDIQVIRLSSIVFSQVRFNRLNEVYRPVFEMAKMFYMNRQPGAYAGDERTFTFLIPLNDLFEYTLYKWLDEGLTLQGYEILYQTPQRYLDEGNKEFTLKPDITVWRGKKAAFIVDAKYKNPVFNGKIDLSESDVYQMLAYAVRYECDQLYLVYPKFRENQGRTNPLATYRIESRIDDIRITPIHVDISAEDLEIAKAELLQALDVTATYP